MPAPTIAIEKKTSNKGFAVTVVTACPAISNSFEDTVEISANNVLNIIPPF